MTPSISFPKISLAILQLHYVHFLLSTLPPNFPPLHISVSASNNNLLTALLIFTVNRLRIIQLLLVIISIVVLYSCVINYPEISGINTIYCFSWYCALNEQFLCFIRCQVGRWNGQKSLNDLNHMFGKLMLVLAIA